METKTEGTHPILKLVIAIISQLYFNNSLIWKKTNIANLNCFRVGWYHLSTNFGAFCIDIFTMLFLFLFWPILYCSRHSEQKFNLICTFLTKLVFFTNSFRERNYYGGFLLYFSFSLYLQDDSYSLINVFHQFL